MEAHDRALMEWLHGEADDSTATALLLAVNKDATQCRHMIETARLERELKAEFAPVDLVERVRLELADTERYTALVMGEVRRHAAQPLPFRRRRQLRQEKWWPKIMGAVAAALVVLGLWLSLTTTPPPPPPPSNNSPNTVAQKITSALPARAAIATANGPLRIRREGLSRNLSTGDHLLAGDELQAGSRSGLRWIDGTVLTIAAGSELIIDADASGKQIELRTGAFAAVVLPQPAGQPLRLYAPHLKAVVVGTELDLRTTANGARLGVRLGQVAVEGMDHHMIAVTAGTWVESQLGAALLRGEGGSWTLGHAWTETVTLGTVQRDAMGLAIGAVSVATTPDQISQWFAPDQVICIQSDQLGQKIPYLARLPTNFRLTLRVRSEHVGKIAVTMAPPLGRPEFTGQLGVLNLPVSPDWSELVLTPDSFSVNNHAHPPEANYPLWTLCAFGFATGRLELSAITIDPPAAP